MDKWTEFKTAYQVARLGTVSAAANALGVHRATVIRHIDALEAELGGTIFHRHRTGYSPTEVGEDLLRVAQTTEEQFEEFAGRTKNRDTELGGDLIITSHESAAHLLLPPVMNFQAQFPRIVVNYVASPALLRLEYGEAHIAVRSGPKPSQPDNVVQFFGNLNMGLYAHESYVEQYGIPKSTSDYRDHQFVCWDVRNPEFPFSEWLNQHIPDYCRALVTSNQGVAENAIGIGMGIGFYSEASARKQPELIQVTSRLDQWKIPLWLVTHVDLHRTAKVQALLRVIKEFQV